MTAKHSVIVEDLLNIRYIEGPYLVLGRLRNSFPFVDIEYSLLTM
jgi:hypothetical protein